MLNSSEWTSLYSLEFESMIVETKIKESINSTTTRDLFIVRQYFDERIRELERKKDET
jgi:hypothetical protein